VDHATRFVFAGPASWPLERAIDWASTHRFTRVDFNADAPANYPATFTDERIARIRAATAGGGISLGLHTLSAVNMAELTPVMRAAVDEYVRQNFALASSLGCGYVIFHGGYHFSGDFEERIAVAIERLRLAVRLGEERGVDVYFENHNREPENAEIHYMPRDVGEMGRFFDAVQSSRLKWAFNVAHANLVTDSPFGFLDAFGVERIGQVRLNDNRGQFEEHLIPGEGNVDFRAVFAELTRRGYTGPFTLDFGGPDDRAAWRDTFAQWLTEAR
jgi:sugar phosphate isomerase/epimerase